MHGHMNDVYVIHLSTLVHVIVSMCSYHHAYLNVNSVTLSMSVVMSTVLKWRNIFCQICFFAGLFTAFISHRHVRYGCWQC